jgi:hypothetical protein
MSPFFKVFLQNKLLNRTISVMTLVGLISVAFAQRGQIDSATRQSTTSSFYVAETGVSRTLSLLKVYPSVAQQNLANWSTTYTGETECILGTKIANQSFVTASTQGNPDDRWVAVDSSNPGLGEFRIVEYTYNSGAGKGTLLIEGRRIAEGSLVVNTALTSNNSVSAIRTVVNANTSISNPSGTLPFLPSLWIGSTTLNPSISEQPNNNGGWLISDGSAAISGNGCPNSTGSGISFHNLAASDGVSGIANPTDIIDTRATNGNPIQYSAAAMPNLPALPTVNLNTLSNGIVYISGGMNQILTFPRNGDVDEAGQIYTGAGTYGRFHYWVKMRNEVGCDLTQGFPLNLPSEPALDDDCNSIDLTVQNTQLQITDGQKVTFYLQGNLNLKTTSKLVHDANWTNFQMYGNKNNRYGTGSTKVINVRSDSTFNTNLFLFAPDATLAIAGNNSNSNVNDGMVWVQTFGAGDRVKTPGNSSGSVTLPNGQSVKSYDLTVLNQLPAEISSLSGGATRSTVGGLASWQREQTR